MSKVNISLASDGKKKPVPWAEAGVAGYYGGDPERPYMGFTVEVDTLEDLARVEREANTRLIVDFHEDGTLASILVYDDYVE